MKQHTKSSYEAISVYAQCVCNSTRWNNFIFGTKKNEEAAKERERECEEKI